MFAANQTGTETKKKKKVICELKITTIALGGMPCARTAAHAKARLQAFNRIFVPKLLPSPDQQTGLKELAWEPRRQ